VDEKLLRHLYTTDETMRLFLDEVYGERAFAHDRVGAMARKIGKSTDDVRSAYRALESTGCGKYVRGAAQRARFEWSVPRSEVARKARGSRR
jgi:hypothetical protein